MNHRENFPAQPFNRLLNIDPINAEKQLFALGPAFGGPSTVFVGGEEIPRSHILINEIDRVFQIVGPWDIEKGVQAVYR